MRRYEGERNDTGGGRGFRIIEAGRYLEPLTPPPPPRAPEPYKVVPSSSSLGRAHRRSSFVIIAETRPATPSSASTSPTLPPTGRVSPFRGRGFKGPLPHAQSTPHTPENRQRDGGNLGRYDRRASVSQQNSPKRSLIPQPTRRRSISLTKNNETKGSPKFGRRAQPLRKNNNVANQGYNNGKLTRRYSLKAPDLSPIQGTPTRPTETVGRYRAGNSLVAKVSPVKTRNNLTVPKHSGNARKALSQERTPIKGVTKDNRRFVEENKKSSSRAEDESKIPVRRGSIIARNGNDLPSNRFVKNETKPPARPAKAKNDVLQPNPPTRSDGKPSESVDDLKRVEDTRQDSSGTRFIDVNSIENGKNRENDLSLVDLLKQSSGVVGTSSVVNTTTTTAVQPLRFDAAAILLENNPEVMEKKSSTATPSSASVDPSPNSISSARDVTSGSKPAGKIDIDGSSSSTSEKKANAREKEVSGSSTTIQAADNTSQKNPARTSPEDTTTTTGTTTTNPSVKKDQTSSTSNGAASKENNPAGETANAGPNLLPRNGVQDTSRGDVKASSGNPGSRGHDSHENGTSSEQKDVGKEKAGSAKTEPIAAKDGSAPAKPEKTGNVNEASLGNVASVDKKWESRAIVPAVKDERPDREKILSRNVGGGKNSAAATNDTTARNDTKNSVDNNKSRVNGSEKSLKSSNGLSTVSAESVRSTDTGVSVNTIRGVSSAREKRGMHMMKRSEEIETLSGNVMHLERNGEPASVLDIAEADEQPQDQTRLGRLKKSLARFGDRCPSMRCLGCRRNQKGQSWMGKQRSQSRDTKRNETSTRADDTSGTRDSRFLRGWNSFKNACRCTRLRECKCCRRASRIAPAESTPCCPPERRCGALCGRLFSCCKCNRSEAQHTRSIRAKHSLTSVAPPPVSEEQRVKIPEVLVEHNSVMRGAIPCLPVPIAWFCLVWNVLLPGSGTVWSGLFTLCVGQPRFSMSAKPIARFGALIVNLIVGVGQFFTVLFCLVGWGWSIWWGVTMVRLARKYKRFRASEAASNDLEARGGEQSGLPGGAPSQALRGMERAR